MVKIRLQRLGTKGQPFYRIVVMEARDRRNGRPIETIGTYNPLTDPETVHADRKRFDHWISQGAVPTDAVRMLVLKEKLKKAGKPKRPQLQTEDKTPQEIPKVP